MRRSPSNCSLSLLLTHSLFSVSFTHKHFWFPSQCAFTWLGSCQPPQVGLGLFRANWQTVKNVGMQVQARKSVNQKLLLAYKPPLADIATICHPCAYSNPSLHLLDLCVQWNASGDEDVYFFNIFSSSFSRGIQAIVVRCWRHRSLVLFHSSCSHRLCSLSHPISARAVLHNVWVCCWSYFEKLISTLQVPGCDRW